MSIVFLFKRGDLVAKRDLSFPRRLESKNQLSSWIPAFAGMTELCAGNEKKEYDNINFGVVGRRPAKPIKSGMTKSMPKYYAFLYYN